MYSLFGRPIAPFATVANFEQALIYFDDGRSALYYDAVVGSLLIVWSHH